MIKSISLINVILINNLSLNLYEGLNVFTGETGAGKSILLEGLGLALGARANFDLIGKFGEESIVSVECETPVDENSLELLKSLSINIDEGIFLKRILSLDGRSKAFINDNLVTLNTLSKIGASIVEIQGQFESHSLINPKNNTYYLDKFCKNNDLLKDVKDAFNKVNSKKEEVLKQELEFKNNANLNNLIKEKLKLLNEVLPKENELINLLKERKIAKNSAEISQAIEEILFNLDGEKSIKHINSKTLTILEKINVITEGSFNEPIEALSRVQNEIDEAFFFISKSSLISNGNPNRINEIDDRIYELRILSNRINENPENLYEIFQTLSKDIHNPFNENNDLNNKKNELDDLTKVLDIICNELHVSRSKGAERLDIKIKNKFPFLKLENAIFKTSVIKNNHSKFTEIGNDEIFFNASTNPNQDLGPLSKIASGGELSRFLLAIKVVMANEDIPKTLVFDEVDSGIGGKTASAVGLRLKKLGEKNQVIVVTHSPQVAAKGENHFLISKILENGINITNCQILNKNESLEEIARMLSGDLITDEARAAAKSLMLN